MRRPKRGTFEEWWAIAEKWVRRDAEAGDQEAKDILEHLDEVRAEERWRRENESVRDWLARTLDDDEEEDEEA